MCCLCTAYLSFSCCCQCVSCYMYAVWQNWIILCDARWINPHCSHELYESVMNWYFEENPSGSFRDVKYLALRNLKVDPSRSFDGCCFCREGSFITRSFILFVKSQYIMAEHLIYSDTKDVLVLAFYHWGSCLMKHIDSSHDHEDNCLTFLNKEEEFITLTLQKWLLISMLSIL